MNYEFLESRHWGMIGFTLGGPIGGILGAIIGSKLSDDERRPSNNQKNQAAFFTALFACFAKIAKADGRVSREEIDKVDQFIKERFNFPSDQRAFAIQIFNHAKDDRNTFDSESCLSRLSMDSSLEETPFSSSVLFLTFVDNKL